MAKIDPLDFVGSESTKDYSNEPEVVYEKVPEMENKLEENADHVTGTSNGR